VAACKKSASQKSKALSKCSATVLSLASSRVVGTATTLSAQSAYRLSQTLWQTLTVALRELERSCT